MRKIVIIKNGETNVLKIFEKQEPTPKANELIIGKLIMVPLKEITEKEFVNKRLKFHKAKENNFWDKKGVSGNTENEESKKYIEIKKYTIKKGDRAWKLCYNLFNIPYWVLKRYNPEIDLADIHEGQVILYPAITEEEE